MRVHVVGSSGTYPARGRPAAGFVVENLGTRVWCDAGPGTFMSLPFDPDLIDAVVVSHQHPDHCSDLFAAFHAWTYGPVPREPVPLFAPPVVWDRVVAFIEREPECFDFTAVGAGDRATIGNLTVDFVAMDHSVPTVGSRWDGSGRTLFYTADTGPGGSWVEAADGVDWMLSEATYQGEVGDKPYAHHLTAGEAGAIARQLGAKRLALTHIPPHLDPSRSVAEAEGTFGHPVRLATPGASFDV